MGRKAIPVDKRKQQINVTLPKDIINKIDAVQTTCNRSQMFEALLRKGYVVWVWEKTHPGASLIPVIEEMESKNV